MDLAGYRKVFRDIVEGRTDVLVGEDKYYIKHLSALDQVDVDDIKDKYYKIVWFAKLELAEKYAKKVEHTQKIMVLEDVDYRDKKLKTDVRYQQLMFGVRVKYMKDFKAQLSTVDQAVLDIPEIDLAIPMQRAEFETLISEPIAAVAQALDTVVAKAGLQHDDIGIVLRTGGSSLIPAVNDLLTQRFSARVVDHDPFTSVAAGLAIANFRQLRYTP